MLGATGALIMMTGPAKAADKSLLILAEKGASDYQIVIPDKTPDNWINQWLLVAGKFVQTAFNKNGCAVSVAHESEMAPNKPAIYLGATRFAHEHQIRTDFEDWSYVIKAIGKDVVIAGRDFAAKDDYPVMGSTHPVALLGTFKGVCDFLREYAGVRFLFLNRGYQKEYTLGKDGKMRVINADGTLKLDTRSIAFMPKPEIAVPLKLNVQKTPPMVANKVIIGGSSYETPYTIANNYFPMRKAVMGATVGWQEVFPLSKYGKTHPEYYAMLPNGKRVSDPDSNYVPVRSLHGVPQMPIDVGNPEVQALMAEAVEQKIKEGASTVYIGVMDRFWLDQCNDPKCNELFGMPAHNFEQWKARAASGNLWKVFFAIANRVYKTYPKAKIVLWNYQDTPLDGPYLQKVKKFPPNVIVKVQYADPQVLNTLLKGLDIPSGISGYSETFTGFSYMGPYAPQKTPEYAAEVVKAMVNNRMRWSTSDGGVGYVPGLQAPAYYVFGRMLDEPSADWHKIYDEFMEAAWGKTASTMRQFFDLQHRQLALFSGYLGWGMPLRDLASNRVDGRRNNWYFLSVYSPAYIAAAEDLLSSAERNADSEDVKARLHLLRIRFDYLKGLAKILIMHDAWKLNPSQASLDAVLDAIDAWHKHLRGFLVGLKKDDEHGGNFKELKDWPGMSPFFGSFAHAALLANHYQQSWQNDSIGWDVEAIREGILTKPHQIKVPLLEKEPSMDDSAWSKTPGVKFCRSTDGMPPIIRPTILKVLRDKDNLYVRVKVKHPLVLVSDMIVPKKEEDVLKQHHLDIAIQPVPNGPIYHLAASPTKGVRYDALVKQGQKSDTSWNGTWSFDYISKEKTNGRHSLEWIGVFKIPFATLGVPSPKADDSWGFNADREVQGHLMYWKKGRITDANALGKLTF